MYNRYIPEPDGSYKKVSAQDRTANPADVPGSPIHLGPPRPPQGKSIADFLGNLMPAGFDTEDMMVVLLLLLMSEECTTSPNMPIITMLIYLFL